MQVSFWEVANTGTKQPGYYILSDQSQLQGIELIDPLPALNWSGKVLIAVFMGCKPTGGYRIFIQNINCIKQKIQVHIAEQIPSPNRVLTQSLVYPGQVVAILRQELPKGMVEVSFFKKSICEKTLEIIL